MEEVIKRILEIAIKYERMVTALEDDLDNLGFIDICGIPSNNGYSDIIYDIIRPTDRDGEIFCHELIKSKLDVPNTVSVLYEKAKSENWITDLYKERIK